MTSRLQFLVPSPRAMVTAAALFTATIAATLLSQGHVKLGVGLVGAIAFVPFAFANPPLALAFWLMSDLLAGLPGFGSAAHRSIIVVALVAIGTAAATGSVTNASAQESLRVRRRQVTLFLLFMLWVLTTLIWAPDPSAANTVITRFVMSTVVFFAVLAIVREPQHVRWLAGAFVIGAVLSILSGVVTGGLHTDASAVSNSTSDQGRLQGGTSDPNYLAAAIVPAIMLTAALAARRGTPILRLLLGFATVILAIGLAATESRGGFIALIVVSIGALIIWRGRRLTIAAFIGVFMVGAAMFFIASPSSWQRVTHNTDKGSGRGDIWQVAWRVVEAHPIKGAGLSQFPVVSPDFLREPGALSRADLLVDQRILVHNAYLQLWAETGIVGLLLFIGIMITGLASNVMAARRFDALGDVEMATMARAAMLALLGSLTASFFLSNIDDQRLWVLMALGPALLAMAQRREHDRELAIAAADLPA